MYTPEEIEPDFSSITYRPVAFNFVDLESKAEEYLEKVRTESKKITQQARDEIARLRNEIRNEQEQAKTELEKIRAESEELRKRSADETAALDAKRKEVESDAYKTGFELGKKEGYDTGHKAGYSDGELQASLDYDAKVKREVQIQLAGKMETLLPALHTVVDQICTAQQSFLQLWEQSAIHVASAIANRAISRQLPEMIDVPLYLLREALELAVGCSQMKIRLNPTDYKTLESQIELLVSELSGAAQTEIVSDERIMPGGCVLETSLGTIDQQIESRLERIEMELV